MYEKHFKLNSRVFAAVPAGADIFVSPQSAESLSRMKQALAAPDTVIAVTGHTGVGKSTLVTRALHSISGKHAIVRIGGKKLDPDDVLERLLAELGTAKVPAGTIQKLRFFRQLLDNLATQNSRVFIIIEDTAKTCPETLSELEALTAADTGFSCGANILLMAKGSLDDLLSLPILARLDQRARLRETIQPFTPDELRGYLNHSLRLAGGEYDVLFADGATELLHTFGGGVAGAVNKIVEAVLTEAAKQKAYKVDSELIKLAAMEEFGLAAETSRQPGASEADNEDAVPELIQDTLPQVEVLDPKVAKGKKPPPQQEKSAASSQVKPSQAAAADKEVPAWDRDPTLAELRPDLDALEHAMAVARGRGSESKDGAPEPVTPDKSANGQAAAVPEITLDNSIQKKVDKAEIDLQQRRAEEAARRAANGTDAEPKKVDEAELELQQRRAEEAARRPANGPDTDFDAGAAPAQAVAANDAENSKLSSAELQQIAADLEKAKTIENVDDKLAETLFGEQLNLAAAQIAEAKTIENVDDKLAETIFGDEINMVAAQVVANLPASEPATSAQQIAVAEPANSPHETAAVPKAPAASGAAASNASGVTQSQRMRTVQALNTDGPPNVAPAKTSSPAQESPPPPPAGDQPDSIEKQISTSVTQSLQALDEKSIPDTDDDDEDDEDDTKKSGFFRRFKRS